MASGIYQIENQINGKRYIGSAVNLKKRWMVHLSTLRCGRHHNRHLQSAFNKYGESAFMFAILEYIEECENLVEREQFYFDLLKPEYNISPTAGSTLGFRHTEVAHVKMAGERHPMYGKTGEQNPMYGKHHSAETLAKMRIANTGERHPMYGKHLSEETRAKISVAQMGERNHNYGKHPSEATRAKMGAAHRGKHPSEATRAKMRVAQRARRRRECELKEK